MKHHEAGLTGRTLDSKGSGAYDIGRIILSVPHLRFVYHISAPWLLFQFGASGEVCY